MIIVTGGSGFIGSNLISSLNNLGEENILVVEELNSNTEKFNNLDNLNYIDCVDNKKFLEDIKNNTKDYTKKIDLIFHLGACSKTTEQDRDYIMDTNFDYSKELLHYCANSGTNFIYASSASVYGSGTKFSEDPKNESFLNHYAESKYKFDQYYREYKDRIDTQVVGLRYFNVFGPRESHKKEMSSVIYHFYHQMKSNKIINLFEGSHGYTDGEQERDFIFVDDTIAIKLWFMNNKNISGIYNVGTGESNTFNNVANAVIENFDSGQIEYIDFPKNLEKQYQAYTKADISSLRNVGYEKKFFSLNESVKKYIDWLSQPNGS
ncbi:MAG: ADP-glyceromanno-heptose 6-epimerase [Gammaproteobacteria bacterium]|nr:ADP-glyceromanno-heptose 6-epimerase [Gammaproteobacteria bacterium]|tara:strand:- start:27020 stop:27982 length:963 start_codon:yes stop_codon:yes gene_type:complete